PLVMFLLAVIWALLTKLPGSVGAVAAGITAPLVFVAALLGTLFLVVVMLASPLMSAAAAVEARDPLEALSRSTSYVMQRPLRYGLNWTAKLLVLAFSAVAGGLLLAVSWGFLFGAMWLVGEGEAAAAALNQALLIESAPEGLKPISVALSAVFWATAFLTLSWWVVVAMGTDVINYLLMRYNCDGATFDQITIAEEQNDQAGLVTAADTAETAAREEAAAETADAQPAAADQG
ncbi:MAG: hypothetical protein OEY28_08015, partial [Nitrospira sp.]|nr:hypothetical protein [Nitrospira sp.]